MAYVISLSNGKGGVAKTTSCIALGGSLAVLGYKVLLIDLDANANLTLGFGFFPEQPVRYSKDLFLIGNDRSVKGLKTGFKNLDIIPSNHELSSLEERTPSNGSLSLLKLALQTSSLDSYDFIVIDCPPSLGFLTTNALTASNLLVIPTQPEFFSAYALQTMFFTIGNIRQRTNPSLKYRVLITLLDLRLREHSNILNQLQKHLGDSLYKTRIQVDTHFRESQTQGVPITYAMPDSRGTLQYKILAQEIVNSIKQGGYQFNKQIPPVQVSSHPTSKSVKTEVGCPYLGCLQDPQTMLTYPTAMNRCQRANPAVPPILTHQNQYCLSNQYSACPMLVDKTRKSLPANLRYPIDKSELLQYLKSWVRAKIS